MIGIEVIYDLHIGIDYADPPSTVEERAVAEVDGWILGIM
jgi:hypothetical protein